MFTVIFRGEIIGILDIRMEEENLILNLCQKDKTLKVKWKIQIYYERL